MEAIDWLGEARRRQDALLRDLSSLLAIPSVKDDATTGPGKPRGIESARALEWMLGLAARHGFGTANIEGIVGFAEYGGPGSLADDADDSDTGASAEYGGSTRFAVAGEKRDAADSDGERGYIAMLSHVDVVPAGGEWTSPPFEAAIRDGKLYARGALDDKGPTIAAYYGLLIVKELGLPMKHRARLIIGTDEETGMHCMDAYNRHEPAPLAGFTPDADFPIVHAEKGQVNTRLTLVAEEASGASSAAPDRGGYGSALRLAGFHSGTAANMVPDAAEAIVQGSPERLKTLVSDFRAFCFARGYDGEAAWTTRGSDSDRAAALRMAGESAHGMAPETGINAGFRLIEFLSDQPLAGDGGRFVRGAAGLLARETSGEALGIACRDDTMGALTVNVGLLRYHPDAGEAFFHLNIRYPSCTDDETIVSTMREKIEPYGFTLTPPDVKRPHEVPAGHPMVRALQTVYAGQTGQEAKLLTTGGGTYACKLANCVAFGPLFPGEEDTAHRPDEWISIDSLLRSTALYAEAIYELANLDYSGREVASIHGMEDR